MTLLARNGPMLRSELCLATGLTGAGISRIARELIDAGLVRETTSTARNGAVGRKSNRLEIQPDGVFVLGVTLTANRVSVGLFNAALRNHLVSTKFKALEINRPTTVVRQLVNDARRLLDEHHIPIDRVAGTGIAVGLLLDTDDGCVSSQALGWRAVPVAQPFEEAFGCPVRVESRAAALLRAERDSAGAGPGKRVFLVNCGIGIGCAGILGGQLRLAGRGRPR